MDATIVYNYKKNINSADFNKIFSELLIATDLDKNILIYNISEIILALYPEKYVDSIVALGNILTSIPNKFQKIRFYTEAWQLDLGGDSQNIVLKIPISGAYINLGADRLVITEQNKLFIQVKLKLSWIQGASKTNLVLKSNSIEVTDIAQETAGITILGWNDLLRDILKNFLSKTLNKQASTSPVGYTLLDTVDSSFEYNHTFAALDIYESIAFTDNEFAWMYPTSVNYAVKDAFRDEEKSLDTSIFAICCMTEGRQNKNAPDVDLTAIPEGSTSAVLISKEIILEKIVLPKFLLMFKNEGNPATKNQFKKLNSQTYTNEVELTTTSLELKDKDGKEDLTGIISKGSLQLKIEDSNISLVYKDVKFTYKTIYDPGIISKKKEVETTVFLSKTYEFTFALAGNELKITPLLVRDDFRIVPVDQDSIHWDEVVLAVVVESVTTTLVALIFVYSAKGFQCLIKCKCGDKVNKVKPGDVKIELANLKGEPVAMEANLKEIISENFDNIEAVIGKKPKDMHINGTKLKLTFETLDELTKNYTFEYDFKTNKIKNEKYIPTELKTLKPNIQKALDNLLKNNPILANDHSIMNAMDQSIDKIDPDKTSAFKQHENIEKALQKNTCRKLVTPKSIGVFVGASLGGILIWMYYKDKEKKYNEYKMNVDKGVNNADFNGINFLTSNLTSKINWPAFSKQHLQQNYFALDGSLVIGLNHSANRRLLSSNEHSQNEKITGYVSPYNPSAPLIHFNPTNQLIEIKNTGNNPIRLSFVLNEEPYQGLLEEKVGKSIEVSSHSQKQIPLADFQIQDFKHHVLHIEAVENDSTYEITLNN